MKDPWTNVRFRSSVHKNLAKLLKQRKRIKGNEKQTLSELTAELVEHFNETNNSRS